jgi:hypothetical protein
MRGIGYCAACADVQCQNYIIYKDIYGVITPPIDNQGRNIETREIKIAMAMDRNVNLSIIQPDSNLELLELFNWFTLGFRRPENNTAGVVIVHDVMTLIAAQLFAEPEDPELEQPLPSNYSGRLVKAMDTLPMVYTQNPNVCLMCCTAGTNFPGFVHLAQPGGMELCRNCYYREPNDAVWMPPFLENCDSFFLTRGMTRITLTVMMLQGQLPPPPSNRQSRRHIVIYDNLIEARRHDDDDEDNNNNDGTQAIVPVVRSGVKRRLQF